MWDKVIPDSSFKMWDIVDSKEYEIKGGIIVGVELIIWSVRGCNTHYQYDVYYLEDGKEWVECYSEWFLERSVD